MIFLKTVDEIEQLRQSNLLVGRALAEVAKQIKPDATPLMLDRVAERFILDNGGIPLSVNFPNHAEQNPLNAIALMINGQIVSEKTIDHPLKEGDIIAVSCGTCLHGFFGFSSYTFCVGNRADQEVKQLLNTAEAALHQGVATAVHGKRIGDISHAVRNYAATHACRIVQKSVGHGIGMQLCEGPDIVLDEKQGRGVMLKHGMCMVIEPMVSSHVGKTRGRTAMKNDKNRMACFGQTIAVQKGRAEILSAFDFIEEVLGKQVI